MTLWISCFCLITALNTKAKVIFCKILNVKYFKYDLILFRIFLSFLESFEKWQ